MGSWRRCSVTACLVLAATSSSLAAQAAPGSEQGRPPTDPPRVTHPDIRKWPTPDQISAALPLQARAVATSGYVTVSCRVTAAGTANECRVNQETPTGVGFGNAALTITSLFVLRPKTIDGIAQDDGYITFVVVFPSR